MAAGDDDEVLRGEVSALGRLLGETLREHEGEGLFALEEKIRAVAKARRAQEAAGERRPREDPLAALIGALTTDDAEKVARAFAHYFQLVNLAEQHDRLRRFRTRRAREQRAGEGDVEAAAQALARHVPRAELDAFLRRAVVELVFTAHPTETLRRTVLGKHRRVLQCLDAPEPMEDELREEVSLLWQTDEIRRVRPRVGDEVKNALFYLEEVLYPLVPLVYEHLEAALASAYGEAVAVPPFLRFGSWVGADMDGNPNVTPEVAVDTALAQAIRVVALHLRGLEELGEILSHSVVRTPIAPALLASIEEDRRRFPELRGEGERASQEPYRRKLGGMARRLEATRLRFLVRRRGGGGVAASAGSVAPPPDAMAYDAPEDLVQDLMVLEGALGSGAAGLRAVRRMRRRVEVFGFHLARLDLRVPAAWVRDEGEQGRRALAAVATIRRDVGKGAAETFLLSMARGKDDMVAALRAAGHEGLYRPDDGRADVSIAPLFETLDDLQGAATEVERALDDPEYGRYVALRGGVQEVMIGYSDSNKDAGILASSFALYRAQRELAALGARRDIRVAVFHGRGGSIGRGGGPARRAILSLPPGALGGFFKLTEQGEVLGWKYLVPEVARGNLELTVAGVLRATVEPGYPDADEVQSYEEAFAEVAAVSLTAYRNLVRDPAFVPYFVESTPLAEVSAMRIGSRPARRGDASSLDDLRAIPWVFAWTQSRQMVPGWFGAGRALRHLLRGRGVAFAQRMRERWPFFATTLDAITVALATADMGIARHYVGLVTDKAVARRLFGAIALDHGRAVTACRAIVGQPSLLAARSSLARSIALRNPYVDPLSFVQVELLRRKRALVADGQPVPEALEQALLLTLNGVAAGLRNTG